MDFIAGWTKKHETNEQMTVSGEERWEGDMRETVTRKTSKMGYFGSLLRKRGKVHVQFFTNK